MKLRNKFMSLALAAAMVVTAAVGLTPATAQAAGADVTLVPQKAEVNAGDTVVVDVKLSGNTGMTYLKLNYTYDAEAFEFVSAADGAVLNGWVEPNVGTLLWKDSLAKENNTANGTIATLTFTAKEGVEGTKNFGLTVAECYDANIDDVAVAANGATVTIAHVHVYGEWTQTTAPTCDKAGEETRECACGHKDTRTVAATGHTFGEWVETTAPTCEAAGVATRECACGHKETKEIAALGHADADKDGLCDACKKEMPKEPVKPEKDDVQTGDSASVMTWVVLMAVAAGAVVVINKKRINA